jgi:hypothetical protein
MKGSARRLTLACGALAVLLGAGPSRALAQSPAAQRPAAERVRVSEARGLLSEPGVIARSIDFASRVIGDGGDVKNGLYPELSNLPTGAGWISVGPGYRHWLFGDHALVDGSTAVSWRSYKMAQARIELPRLARSRLTVGSQGRWQDLTQITYFGEGAASSETDRSEYRLKSVNVAGYATYRFTRQLSIGSGLGWLGRPSVSPPSGRFKRGNPATEDVFPDDPVFALEEQPTYGYGEVAAAFDTRDYRSHPTQGGIYRIAWSHYSDRDAGAFSFDRGEAEAAHFVPVAGSRLVLAMHGWLVGSTTADGNAVPFYLQPSLGGHNTLRAYTDYRFHDRNVLLVNVESRVALLTHVDAAVFVDAGNVAARLSDLNLDKRAYGFGLRMHSRRSTFARMDIAHGEEGWRFLFRLSDPLHLSRLSRHTAAIPFVP